PIRTQSHLQRPGARRPPVIWPTTPILTTHPNDWGESTDRYEAGVPLVRRNRQRRPGAVRLLDFATSEFDDESRRLLGQDESRPAVDLTLGSGTYGRGEVDVGLVERWRWDSNPRRLSPHTLSRRAPSATRTRHRERAY